MRNYFMTPLAIVIIATTIALVSCQYDQQRENYVNDYGNEQAHAQPIPRSYASAPKEPEKPKPTPVAILKQINRHNEDGSYTYGFEGADGSFKIETKLPTGDVKGKYGFVDDSGKVRVVEYGANQYGFQPAGEGITVAPPTLVDETTGREGLEAQNQYQDYDYRQQAGQQAAAPPRPAPAPAQQREQYRPQYEPQSHTQAIYAPAQRTPTLSNAPKQQPIFTPAAAPRQSQILQAAQRPLYDEQAPSSQAYNQGPVQFGPSHLPEQRAQPQARSNPPGGILDQLARDYALPQDVAPPLHDISFGYY
ncbi:pupal cuticle protein 27-like [Leptopilina boulardi]|uniref:pupal cuticle protein 27-like n=1 Tax=Leptopilina boulardi TaxID=63433 RepID=UPI0021F5275B|nr:pupal cuticle protein 27-like [Leptopilina boulardi]